MGAASGSPRRGRAAGDGQLPSLSRVSPINKMTHLPRDYTGVPRRARARGHPYVSSRAPLNFHYPAPARTSRRRCMPATRGGNVVGAAAASSQLSVARGGLDFFSESPCEFYRSICDLFVESCSIVEHNMIGSICFYLRAD